MVTLLPMQTPAPMQTRAADLHVLADHDVGSEQNAVSEDGGGRNNRRRVDKSSGTPGGTKGTRRLRECETGLLCDQHRLARFAGSGEFSSDHGRGRAG